jgi:hypothetical protein
MLKVAVLPGKVAMPRRTQQTIATRMTPSKATLGRVIPKKALPKRVRQIQQNDVPARRTQPIIVTRMTPLKVIPEKATPKRVRMVQDRARKINIRAYKREGS